MARVVSTGQDRETGHAIVRLRSADGRVIALRLGPQPFRTLANGVLGLAKAQGDFAEINLPARGMIAARACSGA